MIFVKTKILLALADTFANYNVQAAHYFLVPRAKSASFFCRSTLGIRGYKALIHHTFKKYKRLLAV